MNQRSVPWLQKIPQGFEEMISTAQELKLFQVGEIGPTHFYFKEEEGEKLRIQIGQVLSCSCSTLKINSHCVHTLFVLLKKFRVNPENPIVWQGSYIGQEIDDLINLKFSANKRQQGQRQSYLQARSGTKKMDTDLKNAKQQMRQPIDEQSICPICQEEVDVIIKLCGYEEYLILYDKQMREDELLTHCRKKCGNNFHIKCLRVWIDHKLGSGDRVTCPMCRTDMTSSVFEDIRRDEDEFNVRYVTHFGKNCQVCRKKNILGNLYHCLLCTNVDLCHACYIDNQHDKHCKFLLRKRKDAEWEIAPIRGTRQTLSLPSLGVPSRVRDQKNSIGQPSSSQDLTEYLVSCFSQFKDICQEQQLASGLSIIGQEVNKNKNSCALCKGIDQQGLMLKLTCGHGLDSTCLRKLIVDTNSKCPTCQIPILSGYSSAYGMEKSLLSTHVNPADENASTAIDKTKRRNIKHRGTHQGAQKVVVLNAEQRSQSQKESLRLCLNSIPLAIQGRNSISQSEEANQVPIQLEKRSLNFRIKKTSTSMKPPLMSNTANRQDMNTRIKEQRDQLQQIIQTGGFQLQGKEIFARESGAAVPQSCFGDSHQKNQINLEKEEEQKEYACDVDLSHQQLQQQEQVQMNGVDDQNVQLQKRGEQNLCQLSGRDLNKIFDGENEIQIHERQNDQENNEPGTYDREEEQSLHSNNINSLIKKKTEEEEEVSVLASIANSKNMQKQLKNNRRIIIKKQNNSQGFSSTSSSKINNSNSRIAIQAQLFNFQ